MAEIEICQDIVIVGAGIAGLSTALGLHRLGLPSLVLESSDHLRVTGFALTLWPNAWKALDALGIADYLRQSSIQIKGLQVASGPSRLDLPFGEQYKNHESRCIRRKELLETLARELPLGTIRYFSKVVSFDVSGDSKVLQLADGHVVKCKVLLGCDGINSVIARWLGLQKPVNAGRSGIRGFVDFPNHDFKPKFHVYIGNGVRIGILPCDANSLYWFCAFKQADPNWHEDMAQNAAHLKEFMSKKTKSMPKDVLDILERTNLDSISCATLRLRLPWDIYMKEISKDGVSVAGDALHPMTPDLGQGGCAALEDGVVLARCLGESFLKVALTTDKGNRSEVELAEVINRALGRYVKERRWRVVSLISAAYMNGFILDNNTKVMSFFKEKLYIRYAAAVLLRMASFDCGKLVS